MLEVRILVCSILTMVMIMFYLDISIIRINIFGPIDLDRI